MVKFHAEIEKLETQKKISEQESKKALEEAQKKYEEGLKDLNTSLAQQKFLSMNANQSQQPASDAATYAASAMQLGGTLVQYLPKIIKAWNTVQMK